MSGPERRDTRTKQHQERLLRALLGGLSHLPLAVLHGLGVLVGWGVILLPNRQRRNALINISLCYPQLPARQKIRLRNRCLREFGKTYLELARLWLRPSDQVLGLVREVRGAELLQRRDGEGLIVLSPHLGAWELAGLHLAAQGPTTIFYKPQQYLDDLIVAARNRSGATLAPITGRGIRSLVQGLARGEYAGILPDQEPRASKGAAFAPLFGLPAWTMVLVNRLARKSGARVIFMFAERLPWAAGYRVHCLPAPEGIDSVDDAIAAAALNRGIEQCIAVCPEQYLWPYRRFRRRPQDGPKAYTGGVGDYAAIETAERWRRLSLKAEGDG
ncbi:lysophospholipid acyltransferase family protein [Thiohalocapsa marina]|uniref:Lysophospholipid acyltransferase family protein n=1 Tax=Thiohalocapsa marina TaxID=424902 RepID=A0A5M8FG08_9GAMM|nr:lysophospholipid acyltransferase family protein [Thiohalocapsa marina]KAA6183647.1 lysophospholipid acyltransferase family protein [Thiohalocapsa marina]